MERPFPVKNRPTDEEVTQETEHSLSRDVILYHRITDAEYGSMWVLCPVNSPERREVTEKIGPYFHRETHLDFFPYTAADEGSDRPVFRAVEARPCCSPTYRWHAWVAEGRRRLGFSGGSGCTRGNAGRNSLTRCSIFSTLTSGRSSSKRPSAGP